jgi:hypothetical protein
MIPPSTSNLAMGRIAPFATISLSDCAVPASSMGDSGVSGPSGKDETRYEALKPRGSRLPDRPGGKPANAPDRRAWLPALDAEE